MQDAGARAGYFLQALLTHTKDVLQGLGSESYRELAATFRAHMGDGQRMSGHGTFRRTFYFNVIRKAKELHKLHVCCIQLCRLIST